MIIELKEENLDVLLKIYKNVIIDFYANWCGPCKMLATQLDNFAKANTQWTIIRVDCDKYSRLAGSYSVQALPTLVITVNGQIKETIVGFKPLTEIEKITNKY